MKHIQKIPLALSAVSLSLAALGNLLRSYGEGIRTACGILSGALLLLYLLRVIFDAAHVREELKNPVAFSILPTATMALMLLCAYVKPYVSFAEIVWYAAAALQVVIMLLFAKRFVLGFAPQTVFPSWFIVGAGIAVASVTSPAMGARPVGQIAFYVGLALYILLLPIVIHRMVKLKPLPEPARPTIAIFTAPMSLCLAGYLAAFEQPSRPLVLAMLAVAALSYLYVTVQMFSLLRLPFYPTYAAFTFPYVISAVAFKSANAFLTNGGGPSFAAVVTVCEWLSVCVVAYVLIRFALSFAPRKAGARQAGVNG